MIKKRAIKIVTAAAIAASAFTAVAPAQSEAAANLNIQIKAAKAKMITPYHKYTKSTKLASEDTITVYIKQAKKAQKDINTKIKKSKLSKSKKNKKFAEIKAYNKYITRAEGYVKAYQEAKAAQNNLNELVAELQKTMATKDAAAILDLYTKLQEAIKEAKIDITVKVSGSKIQILLFNKFTKPTETHLDRDVEKDMDTYKHKYENTNKAEAAKVNAYVKLANGDLSTKELVDAAKKAKAEIDLSKLKVADQSKLHRKLKDADKKVAAAESALQGPSVVGVKAVNAKELVVTFNVAVDAIDAADKTKYAVEGETITNAAVSENAKTVILTTENELNVTNAKVTVSPIKSKEDAKVLTTDFNALLTFADTTPVSVQDVEVIGTTAVITFNEPVQDEGTIGIDKIAMTSGYSLSGNKLTITSLPADAEKPYKLNIVGATDFANNIAKPIVVTIK